MLYHLRRKAQNAADHAALAAAWASCHGDDPAAAAEGSVQSNGFAVPDLTLTDLGGHQFEAIVGTSQTTHFARVIGFEQVDVDARALAVCSGGTGFSNAIFAGGDDCHLFAKLQFESSGSNQTVYGGIHSNSSSRVNGSNSDLGVGNIPEDPYTYVVSHDETGSGNMYDPGFPAMVALKEWPAGFGPADIPTTLAAFKTLALSVSPATHYVVGDIPGSYITANGDGLYYATGNIDLNEDLVASVTLVAEGTITVGSSVNTLDPYPVAPPGLANVLAYSGADPAPPPIERCDKFTVRMNGSTSDWTGLVVGPAGLVEFSGSSNTTLTGSIIGWGSGSTDRTSISSATRVSSPGSSRWTCSNERQIRPWSHGSRAGHNAPSVSRTGPRYRRAGPVRGSVERSEHGHQGGGPIRLVGR